MNDRELLTAIKSATRSAERKMLYEELWFRYENLVHKNWSILCKQMNNSPLVRELHDDFYSEAYIAFTKAVTAIKLEKILNDKWKFIGYFRLYLKNVRSDMIDLLLKTSKAEKSFYLDTADGEVARLDLNPAVVEIEGARFDPVMQSEIRDSEENCRRSISECMAAWEPRRQEIFRMRAKGISKGDIAIAIGVHPSTITYYLSSMREDLESKLYRG